ncbi:condensation domain-containing protein [Kitasatospora sp. NPDC059722]|uniref:condensation domain-containing protein n=1 Tax=Kitasatospora sp. NPDC059722 TaxID=3346925 RepID=UPI0036B31F2D
MTRTSRRITVRYDGASSGTGPLTLGQDNMLRCIRNDAPAAINRESVWPVPDGVTVPQALRALRELVERHESLRTSFPRGSGEDGFPDRQVVHAEGEFDVTVVDAADVPAAGLDPLAEALGRADVALPFDVAAAPRLRFILLAYGDRVLRLIAVVCHAGADGAATAVLIEDWLDLAAGKELPPVTAPTPLRVAAVERSPRGLRRTDAALRHWARLLATGPLTPFADARIAGPPDHVGAVLVRSAAGARDLAAVCRRTGAGPSVVVLAAFAALAAQRAGGHELMISALSSNRQRAAMTDHVGTLAQDALLLLDTGVADFDRLVGRAKSAALRAYWHSTLDAEQVWRLVEDTAHLRGARYPRRLVVNDVSQAVPDAVLDTRPAPAADPELIRLPDQPIGVRLMFTVLRHGGVLEFVLSACPQVLDAAETEAFARRLLALLAAAAHGPVPLAARPATLRAGEWRQVDGSWIDLAALRTVLAEVLGAAAVVECVDGRLVARLTTGDPALTPAVAHRAVVAALPGRDTVMAPHHYVVHGPGGTTEGDGRDPVITARLAGLA